MQGAMQNSHALRGSTPIIRAGTKAGLAGHFQSQKAPKSRIFTRPNRTVSSCSISAFRP